MSQESSISAHTFNRDTAPVNSEGQVVCYHEELAISRTSHTTANPNRDFYACRKDRDDPRRCRFFVWADDRGLCAAIETRRAAMRDTTASTPTTTPQPPSQAQRAQVARSPDTPISPQKRRRSSSPMPSFPLPVGAPSTPKHKRLNGGAGTPESRAARKKTIADELAAVAQEQRMTPSANRGLPQTNAFPNAVQESQNRRRSAVNPAAARSPPSSSPSFSLSPATQRRTPMSGMGALHSSQSRHPSSQGVQSEAAYSITDEVRLADMEDEIEDTVWIEHELDLEDKQIQADPIEDDEDFDGVTTIHENEVWSSRVSHNATSSPSSTIPFTLPATRTDVNDDDDSGPTQSREPRRVSRSSPARLPPQTPSSRQAGSLRAYASGGNMSEVDGGERSMNTLLTPPGSLQRDHQRAEDGAFSSTGRRNRDGSINNPLLHERQRQARRLGPSPSPSNLNGSDRERSQWQMIQDDPENPFHDRAAALWASSQAQTSSAIDTASAVEIRGGLPGPLSADLVEQQIASLAGLPEYIRKLERRERAAQKSAEVKAKGIARLEEEVQRLRSTNRTLEATVASLEARR